jgi:Methylamine utilisation protein MauE
MALDEISVASHIAYALQLSLGLVFLLAVIPKILRPSEFVSAVTGYALLPERLAGLAAAALIIIESLLAASFLSGWQLSVALPMAAALLVVFASSITINIRRGRRIACGCFGNSNEQISSRSLARLALLLAAVLTLLIAPATPVTIHMLGDSGWTALSYLVDVAAIAAFTLVCASWLLNLPELAYVVRHLERDKTDLGRDSIEEAA